MSRQDKATTEKHTKILRELVKQGDNKVCVDCKHNDPRWASWNLGVFLCIRCSGIHRGMGTHISKVKSVDLDVWTPEQMESITKWGNRRANLYWEGHLKPGHVPPEHKMESFIRSKYESRRWALDGPPPKDPSVLEDSSVAAAQPSAQPTPQPVASSHAPTSSISSRPSASSAPITTRQPQPHRLLSTAVADRKQQARSPAQAKPAAPVESTKPPPAPENDLFSLDFHAPSSASPSNASSPQPKKDVKNDILSLFSTPAAVPPAQAALVSDPWGQFSGASQPQAPQPQATSLIGSNGTGAWGVSSGWSAPAPQPAADPWGSFGATPVAPQQPNLFGASDPWASQPSAASTGNAGPAFGGSTAQKKDDAFGDLWGSFK
ncbi:hypothetical protein PLICRDRAFT_102180 [Plicaturopsis crispa FD-325 SS-3]|nr:hypothetical protein PLICRDRAFT_102180 [Plicaturopsis crispa FD-325 SS-3]